MGDMETFKRILVYAPLGDDELLALRQATSIARENGASITVMRVLREEGAGVLRRSPGTRDLRVRELLEESQREVLEKHAAPLRESGLDVRVELRWGTPWMEIIRRVLAEDHDLVIKAAEGEQRRFGPFFGSTAMHLIRKCPCPVWVLGGGPSPENPRVLAAIDPVDDPTRSAVARKVLALSAELAGDEGTLLPATVWRAPGEQLLRGRMPAEELASYVASERDAAREGLERTIDQVGVAIPEEQVLFLKGEARDALPQLASELECDVLVMGSVGRVGIAGLLIGETAEGLVRSLRCSTVVVKPPGFVCPVEAEA